MRRRPRSSPPVRRITTPFLPLRAARVNSPAGARWRGAAPEMGRRPRNPLAPCDTLRKPMSRIGAFFDVDRTLVACNTGRLFLRDLRRRGEISFLRALRALGWMAKYHLSLIDLQVIAAHVAQQMRGKSESEFAERCHR